MIRLMKSSSLCRIYTIDHHRGWVVDAKEQFIEELAALLHDQVMEGFYLGAITHFYDEHVVVFVPRPTISRDRGGLFQYLKRVWNKYLEARNGNN